MSLRLNSLLAVAACGCTLNVADPPAAGVPSPAVDDVGADYTGPVRPEPPNPCAVGMAIQFQGATLILPVPCVRFYRDLGDPPPKSLAPEDPGWFTPGSR